MNLPNTKTAFVRLPVKLLQGALIGLGSVLPGISGGVLSVVFGVYPTIMELLACPRKHLKTHIPKLFPYLLGSLIGFLGVANLLSYFLNKYPQPSVCLFAGLILGMLPSLWEEAGTDPSSPNSSFHPFPALLAMAGSFLGVTVLLSALNAFSFHIAPHFGWYLFCGFCLALSIIAPGMSFSTLLMPLGLYTPFVEGLGRLDPAVLLPGGAGALLTLFCLTKLVNSFFTKHYTVAFHGILGIVTAATLIIVPFKNFAGKTGGINLFCIAGGLLCAPLLERFQNSLNTEKAEAPRNHQIR